MTYRELYEKATKQLEKSEITLGEYEEMTKPLDRQIGTCKDCKYRGEKYEDTFYECIKHDGVFENKFYCVDFEKRGNENG